MVFNSVPSVEEVMNFFKKSIIPTNTASSYVADLLFTAGCDEPWFKFEALTSQLLKEWRMLSNRTFYQGGMDNATQKVTSFIARCFGRRDNGPDNLQEIKKFMHNLREGAKKIVLESN